MLVVPPPKSGDFSYGMLKRLKSGDFGYGMLIRLKSDDFGYFGCRRLRFRLLFLSS